MLTYDMGNRGEESLYGHLYCCIKSDIECGVIVAGEKLPSKRALAKHLGVSLITVEGAYAQLIAEGYVHSEPRRGYFANELVRPAKVAAQVLAADSASVAVPRPAPAIDLTGSAVAANLFPFGVWSRTLRDLLAHEPEAELLGGTPPAGSLRLRCALADHLRRFRGLDAQPERMVVAAGAQTLYTLLVQLLGRSCCFAVEDPGYPRLASIYQANGAQVRHVPLDDSGISVRALAESGANVAHLTPSHQFPTGFVTPVSRRYELLGWATEVPGRYLVEDDYDCEFRLAGRPIPTLQSIDAAQRVVYVNTFSRSLGPAFRVAYMVLPPHLAEKFHDELGFYSCTVSTMEQLALARFIENGDFERHLNRMRSHYRSVRDELLRELAKSPLGASLRVEGADAGLHFVLGIGAEASEGAIAAEALRRGVAVMPLSRFSREANSGAARGLADASQGAASGLADASQDVVPVRRFVVGYAGLARKDIPQAVEALAAAVAAAGRAH